MIFNEKKNASVIHFLTITCLVRVSSNFSSDFHFIREHQNFLSGMYSELLCELCLYIELKYIL